MKSLPKLVVVFLFLQSKFLLSVCTDCHVIFNPNKTMIEYDTTHEVHLVLSNTTDLISDNNYVVKTVNDKVVVVDNPDEIVFMEVVGESGKWEAHVRIRGVFLRTTQIFVEKRANNGVIEVSNEVLDVIVLRPKRLVDTLFAVTVVLLLAILFINFGAAIDIEVMKQIYRRPIGPAIRTCCQLVFVPLIAYGLGFLYFPDSPELALGLYLTGVAGGVQLK